MDTAKRPEFFWKRCTLKVPDLRWSDDADASTIRAGQARASMHATLIMSGPSEDALADPSAELESYPYCAMPSRSRFSTIPDRTPTAVKTFDPHPTFNAKILPSVIGFVTRSIFLCYINKVAAASGD